MSSFHIQQICIQILPRSSFYKYKLWKITPFEEALAMVIVSTQPYLFRNLVKNTDAVADMMIKRLRQTNETFRSQTYTQYPYDFMRGSNFALHPRITIDEALDPENNHYLSFEPFLIEEEIYELIGKEIGSKTHKDSNFIGNFKETIVTANTHGAPLGMSWAVQIQGKKTWFLWHPDVAYAMNGDWFARTVFPGGGSEAKLFSYPTYKVVVNPGEVLTFPPHWMHTVITHAGPNILLNLRTTMGRNWMPSFFVAARNVLIVPFLALFTKGAAHAHNCDSLRQIRLEDLKAAFTNSPNALRNAPVESFL